MFVCFVFLKMCSLVFEMVFCSGRVYVYVVYGVVCVSVFLLWGRGAPPLCVIVVVRLCLFAFCVLFVRCVCLACSMLLCLFVCVIVLCCFDFYMLLFVGFLFCVCLADVLYICFFLFRLMLPSLRYVLFRCYSCLLGLFHVFLYL